MAAISAVASGNWISDAATVWSSGAAPASGDTVTIGGGFTVTLDTTAPVATSVTVASTGTLTCSTSAASTLTLQQGMTVASGGTLNLDVSSSYAGLCTIILNASGGGGAGYGLIVQNGGSCTLKGFPKKRLTRLNGAVVATGTSITVDDATGWQTGDKIVLGTTQAYNATPRHDLSLGTNTVSGSTVSSMTAFAYDHADNGYVGNLSSNLVITPNTAGGVAFVSLQHGATACSRYVENVEFRSMGSTSLYLDIGFYSLKTVLSVSDNVFYDHRKAGLITYRPGYDCTPARNIFYTTSTSEWHIEDSSAGYSGTTHDECAFFRGTGGVRNWGPNFVMTNSVVLHNGVQLSAGQMEFRDTVFISNSPAITTYVGSVTCKNCSFGTEFGATASIVFRPFASADILLKDCYVQSTGTLITSEILASANTNRIVFANKNIDPSVQETYTSVSNTVPTLERDNSTYYGASGSSLKVTTSTKVRDVDVPLQIFAPNTKPVTVSGFIRRSAGQAVTVTLSGLGITSSVYTCIGANDTWEQFLVGGTNTTGTDGMLDVTITVTSGIAGTVHIDGVSAPTPVAVNTGDFGYWYSGLPVPVVAANFVAVADVWNAQTSELTLAGSIGLKLAKTAIDVNITQVNGVTVDGTGTDGDPWGPV